MTSSSCVTYDDVMSVCHALKQSKAHEKITTRLVREQLGRGSLSTISRHIKEWHEIDACLSIFPDVVAQHSV